MKRLSKKNKINIESIKYNNVGVFIKSINNKKNGDHNKYWQYWVNSRYAQIASDKYLLKDKDTILWKFTSSKYKQYE